MSAQTGSNFCEDRVDDIKEVEVRANVERLLPDIKATIDSAHDKVEFVLGRVFADPDIIRDFGKAFIRLTTMRAKVSKEILRILLGDEVAKQIGVLAIGDIDPPEWFKPIIHETIRRAGQHWLEISDKYGSGYDLRAKGAPEAREAALNYFDRFYKFSDNPGLLEAFNTNSTLTPGGLAALTTIALSMSQSTDDENQKRIERGKCEPMIEQRFIYSSGSTFPTWKAVTRTASIGNAAKRYELPTKQENLLHLSEEDVNRFYDEHGAENVNDNWYVIPVGNPSGTSMDSERLYEVCKAIVTRNPSATITLDCVYVRMSGEDASHDLMAKILEDPQIMDRAIFIESFSKTHGICGERAAMFFAKNKDIYDGILQSLDMTLFAGHGHALSGLVMAAAEDFPEMQKDEALKKLYTFWQHEKKGLYNYLFGTGQFADIFDDNQCHITQDQLDRPVNLYLTLKLKPGIEFEKAGEIVAARTKCFGVPEKNGKDVYMRFSVGTLTEETFSKYAY